MITTYETDSVDIHQGLKKYFGFDGFRGLQEPVIKSILAGKDSLVIMPTGGGKSLCYQLPALMSEGMTIVVSPLIALMKNQIDTLRGLLADESIAHVLNSSLNKKQLAEVQSDIRVGKTKLLYIAPESLSKDENIDLFKDVKIEFIAVDEAHCISEWGHDFRPDYRKISHTLKRIGRVPIMALTATATPKVQEDITKNLRISKDQVFLSSFNRPNLYYEVRPKENINKQLISVLSDKRGKSGIIYCMSKKKVNEVADFLQVNGFKALPYHAGMDTKTRGHHQDMFLKQDVDIIVATIAFGMGIDKPDIRFVIHYDMPRSLESYYQETGRAGRDGGEGHCLAFYKYADIERVEKLMSDKPPTERELGYQLLQEVVAYAETSISRRKFLLHYFGEEFDEETDKDKMDDNLRFPKKKFEAKKHLLKILTAVEGTDGLYKIKELSMILRGESNALIKSHNVEEKDFYGIGKKKDKEFWTALIRQAVVGSYLLKKIETYGTLLLTDKGRDFLANPTFFEATEDHMYTEDEDKNAFKAKASGGDPNLLAILKRLCKTIAKEKNIPPFAIFQDATLEHMAIQYPVKTTDLKQIHGVGEGKAMKFGQRFVEVIAQYVEENEIIRPDDLIVKSKGSTKSALHSAIIKGIDRKVPLEDLADAKNMDFIPFIEQIEHLVLRGININIDYHIDSILEQEIQDEIFEFLSSSDSDDVDEVIKEFEDDCTEEEVRLTRIKYLNNVGN